MHAIHLFLSRNHTSNIFTVLFMETVDKIKKNEITERSSNYYFHLETEKKYGLNHLCFINFVNHIYQQNKIKKLLM